ncbi:serine-pyruvate transaminase [Heterostelium album PN500]|uniref:alanine--glyoxylate transaminase n=1 Tax=Heterostelium pallidum (strain ATCC 26659 / Pp 5 / PN500) TaxID=670386 RepID=D3AWU9_HETP5|nr:serine-pyruvate transaminase [Heterostelium album PN500]EFA86772.1 serine-pyruvate transaminase [Heterostelium album PN500]|eukprot:XP_020438876.1 serine-pyruvate transaminase [Heterostelium album PN500]
MKQMFNVSNAHRVKSSISNLPVRLLLGPGPSNLHPRVNQQLSTHMIGYTDQNYYKVMDETMEMMRYLFQTNNHFTIPITGAGTAAMEACVANLIEPGDNVVCCVSGYFSDRIYQMAQRYGANILKVDRKWGTWFSLDDVRDALVKHKPSLLTMVFGETSTGVKQAMAGIGQLCKEHNCLLMVDTVAALGGVPFFVDDWKVDACYTGGQKCLSGPPGISPITFSPLACAKIANRKTPVANWYLDAMLLGGYWCPEYNFANGTVTTPQPLRRYHHTTPANLVYALRESILMICEEGIENTWNRHQDAAKSLYKGLESIGLKPYLADTNEVFDQGGRLFSLTTVAVPDGLDAKLVMKYLLDKYNIEIAGGLGELAGKVWRVGLMGFNANQTNVKLLISALEEAVKASK